MGLPDGDYLFGRVVAGPLDRSVAPMPGSFLVYIYRHRSPEPAPNHDELRRDCLLIAPAFVNQLGFTKGYLNVVDNRPVENADLLPNHCFRRWNGDYLDERGRPLKARTEPCGEWGLGNYRTLDDQLSDALGIPRAPVA